MFHLQILRLRSQMHALYGVGRKTCVRRTNKNWFGHAPTPIWFSGLLGRPPEHMLMGLFHGHMLMALAHEQMPMGLAHEHVLMGLVHEHVLMGLVHKHMLVVQGHEHIILMGLAHKHVVMGMAQEHILMGLAHEHMFMGPDPGPNELKAQCGQHIKTSEFEVARLKIFKIVQN